MTTVTTERVKGHYEVVETLYGKDYVWVPGEEEVERRRVEEVLHPWHAAYEEWKKQARTQPERQAWLELEEL